MEEVEDTFVVGAIGWLVQTILENLFSGKLEAWIRGVGLADDIEKLRSEVERVEMVVTAVKGRAIGNKPLARSLARLKELLYDADDAVDDLDYYRLQQQVQGVAGHDTDGTDGHGPGQVESLRGIADIPSRSRGKKRSRAWEDFEITEEANGKPVKAKCIHCLTVVKCGSDKGTSVLHNHLRSDGCKKKRGASDQQPNTSSTAEGTTDGNSVSRKRMRMDEESTYNTAANTPSWNKAECSNRVQQITRQLQDIRVAVGEVLNLHRSDSVASPCNHQSTTPDPCLRTSNLVQRKVYGRCAEKDSIIKLMKADKSDSVTVLPIVGIGGTGKTALAQFAYNYNDPGVENLFDHRIWVSVSKDFDEVRLIREMLDFVSQEMHAGISSFAKLQEMLKRCMDLKRSLLILDDVWNDMDDYRWNNLLAPLKSDNAKGNVILVTTRNLSVAKKIGTVEPIKLAALENKDFWLLFKACAFNDENYEGHPSLNIIGQQIAEKLQGNPLAAETAGVLLREQLTIDHWSNILKNQDWKSLQLSRGIMPALKLSYDQLPYHLQQCFLYCCIFPKNYQFVSEELIRIWIAQGFVNGGHSSKRLEEIGQDYLFDLVNSGFFQQTEREVPSLGNQTCYVMCGLMHDFAMAVSRTECATIDGLQRNEMLPTVHHLSIVTDSANSEDQHAKILRNEFEKKLLNAVTSVRRLRTLVLIGQYDTSFFQLFQNLFKEAQNLRVLRISGNCAVFNCFMCNVANPTHLRYLNIDAGEEDVSLPQVLSKFCHLQVLDVGSSTDLTISNGVNLVSLRHLVAEEGACSFIVSSGKMTSLQELDNFMVDNSRGFKIKQLQSMNELVQLGVSQLENVKTREEAYEAGLINKQHLGKLHLSWYATWSQHEYDSDMSSESSRDRETEEESSPMDDSGPSSEPSRDTAREVLEGLEPHHNLKHLRISGYDGASSPEWLATSLTSLQTLHLECCGKWRILPSLERLLFLRKLDLRNMGNVTEVLLPSLEELVLDEMPILERCSCTSVRDLNSSLRVLKIKRCPVLMVFPLFESSQKFKIEQKSWLSSLGELIIHKCPQLLVPHPLPHSTSDCPETLQPCFPENLTCLKKLQVGWSPCLKSLQLHSCTALEELEINGSGSFISLEGLQFLGSLRLLRVSGCLGYHEQDGRWLLPQSLGELRITGDCPETLQPCFPENLTCLKKLQVGREPSLKSLLLHSCTALEELEIKGSGSFISLEGLQFLSSLRLLQVSGCLGDHEQDGRWLLPQSLGELQIIGKSPKTLLPCFPENLTRLKILQVENNPGLKSLQLHSCTALEELTIRYCGSLDSIEGLQSLGALRHLKVSDGLPPCFENLSIPRLETLEIDDPSALTSSFCKHLTSLQQLCYFRGRGTRLTDEQDRALQLLASLKELQFVECWNLVDLPAGLHSLPNLKRLLIQDCKCISRLPEKGLPPPLEELQINRCSEELTDQCRKLATSKLKVKIIEKYVN